MRRRRPNPAAWAVLTGVVLLVVLVARVCLGGSDYPVEARALAQDSAALGTPVGRLRDTVEDLNRVDLVRQLRGWTRTARAHVRRVQQLVPPEDYRIGNGYLVAALGLRAQALAAYEPALLSAISDRDIEVASVQVLSVLEDMVTSDRLFARFVSEWPEADTRPQRSRWVANPERAATLESATAFVRELRDEPALQRVFNLKVVAVSVSPRPTGRDRDLDRLPFSSSVSATVVVVNDGNQPLPATVVTVTLKSETDPRPQSVEGRIPRLVPNQRRSVSLARLEPTAGGPVNLITVTAGPLTGERNVIDNTLVYRFVMARP